MPELQIGLLYKDDVYKDLARVAESHRRSSDGQIIPEGTLCLVTMGSRKARLFLRGDQSADSPAILLDERTRNVLGVEVGQVANLHFKPLGSWGEIQWAWSATEPAYRIAARIAVLSFFISIVGLIIGLLSLFPKG